MAEIVKIQLIVAVSHIVFSWVFIYEFELKLVGLAIALNITYLETFFLQFHLANKSYKIPLFP
jgi:Na+-driven multidrug efflux pump